MSVFLVRFDLAHVHMSQPLIVCCTNQTAAIACLGLKYMLLRMHIPSGYTACSATQIAIVQY